ncbi:hypothetical protein ONS96_014335 [Cadophora gregata f. sp. sojae]|nr:hypothetical protein ONS96_014335 [Cadophora gregata f. sp. sojae]
MPPFDTQDQDQDEHVTESWRLSLPSIHHIILSLDTLSQLLAPPSTTPRIPGSAAKLPGEIRPRSKSLQQVLRAVMFFEGGAGEERVRRERMREIGERIGRIGGVVGGFLRREEVCGLLGCDFGGRARNWVVGEGRRGGSKTGFGGMERVKGGGDENVDEGEDRLGEIKREMRKEILFAKKIGSVELKRRRDALGSERRERVLKLMEESEVKIEEDMRAVEDVMWPRRIIKFDSSSPSISNEPNSDESHQRIVRAWIWICELAEEIWEDGGEAARGILTGCWRLLRARSVSSWVVVLVGGLAVALAVGHVKMYWQALLVTRDRTL